MRSSRKRDGAAALGAEVLVITLRRTQTLLLQLLLLLLLFYTTAATTTMLNERQKQVKKNVMSRRSVGEGGGVLDGRDVLDSMYGRSHMNKKPRTPTMPRRSTSGLHQRGRPCPQQSSKHREVLGESHEGVRCILLRTTWEVDLRMDDQLRTD